MKDDVSRRDLLKAGMAFAAAGFCAGAGAQSEAPKPNACGLKLGLVTYNLAKDWDLDTILERCNKTGFNYIELRTTHAHMVEPDLDAAARSEVRKKFADSGLTLFGLGSVCEFQSPDPAEVRKNIETCRQFIQLAADVGAQGVKVRPNGLPKGVEPAKTLEQIGKSLAECGKVAADAGIKLYMEVHGGGTSEPANARTILDHADHPNVYACWNSNPTDVKDGSVKEGFDLLKDRLLAVHLRDLDNPKYPHRELVGLLEQIDFQGPSMAEINPSTDPVRLMGYFRALWEEMQQSSGFALRRTSGENP